MTVTKKAVTKKTVAKKAIAKKAPPVKKAVANKAVAKKAVAKTTVAKKAVAKKPVAGKAPAIVAAAPSPWRAGLPVWPATAPPPPPPPGSPYVANTKSRSFRPLFIAIAVVVAIAAVSVLRNDDPAPARTVSPDALKALATCAPSIETPEQAAAALAPTLITAPAGFIQIPDAEKPNGPISLTDAAARTANPQLAEASLRARGMAGGYRRTWHNPTTGVELHVVMYRFTCASGLRQHMTSVSHLDRIDLVSATTFPVTVVPGGWGATAAVPDSDGAYRQDLFAAKSSTWIGVYLFSANPLDGTTLISDIAKQQYDKAT